MSNGIFVVVEQRNGKVQNVGLELIGEATRLKADPVSYTHLDVYKRQGQINAHGFGVFQKSVRIARIE